MLKPWLELSRSCGPFGFCSSLPNECLEQISSNKLLQGVYFQQKPPDSPLYLTFKAVFSIMLGPPFTHLRTLGLIVVVVNPSVIRWYSKSVLKWVNAGLNIILKTALKVRHRGLSGGFCWKYTPCRSLLLLICSSMTTTTINPSVNDPSNRNSSCWSAM